MATILISAFSNSFITHLLSLFSNTKPIKKLLSLVDVYQKDCFLCELKKQIQTDSFDLQTLTNYLDPENYKNLPYCIQYFLYYCHFHTSHSAYKCPEFCGFHGGFKIQAFTITNCAGCKQAQNEYFDNYFFTVNAYDLFTPCPEFLSVPNEEIESLVFCYLEKLIINYSNFLFSCGNCGFMLKKMFLAEEFPESLIFYVDYSKPPNILEAFRIIASFPDNFNTFELFESKNLSAANYTILGFLLQTENSYTSLIYDETISKWLLLKDNHSTIVSKFDAIYSSIISDESMVIAAFYNKGQNKHIEMKEKLWLHIEKKIVNVYSNNDETKANVLKPYLLKY